MTRQALTHKPFLVAERLPEKGASFVWILTALFHKDRTMSITTLTSPGHVDGLTSGYKRSFNSIGPVAVGEFKRPASLPASAIRNDRGTNATLSVARCCSIPVCPGEVAFVRTGKGLRSLGEGTNFLPVVTLSQINEMLLNNPVTPMQGTPENASNLLTKKNSKHIFGIKKSKAVPLSYDEFDPAKITDDLSHPLHAYALDGVVCAASDARGGQGDRRGYTTREEAAGCNVAVGGQSPLVAVSMKGQAARMTSRVYVVLVANRVVSGTARPRRTTPQTPFFTGASASAAMNQSLFSTDAAPPYGTSDSSRFGQEWVFQYELVTSAELDIDPAVRKFKVERISNNTSNRVVVKMWQLGVVTDLNSGHQSLPTQFTLNVNVRPFHGVKTQKINTVDGKQSWVKLPPSKSGPEVVFFPPSKAEQRKQNVNYILPANAYLRRMRGHRTCFDRGMPKQCGFAAAVTGPSAAEFAALQAAIADQNAKQAALEAALAAITAQLNAARDAAQAAAKGARASKRAADTAANDTVALAKSAQRSAGEAAAAAGVATAASNDATVAAGEAQQKVVDATKQALEEAKKLSDEHKDSRTALKDLVEKAEKAQAGVQEARTEIANDIERVKREIVADVLTKLEEKAAVVKWAAKMEKIEADVFQLVEEEEYEDAIQLVDSSSVEIPQEVVDQLSREEIKKRLYDRGRAYMIAPGPKDERAEYVKLRLLKKLIAAASVDDEDTSYDPLMVRAIVEGGGSAPPTSSCHLHDW
ncbi:hypothetical protein N9S30_00140 [bacterium]|nr:hypothetical protein [bacterium]